MEPIKRIRDFIINNYLFGDVDKLKSNTNLFKEGIIDSTGVIELISFIENTFNITVKDEDLIMDNFSSLVNISNFIISKSN